MSRSWWAKLAFLIVVTVGSALYVTPTVLNLDPAKTKFPVTQKINLGLDLQGGVYMVLGVDFRKVFGDVADRLADNLNDDMKKKNMECGVPTVVKSEGGQLLDDPKINVECKTDAAKQ